jgi:hypothetical protein
MLQHCHLDTVVAFEQARLVLSDHLLDPTDVLFHHRMGTLGATVVDAKVVKQYYTSFSSVSSLLWDLFG